MQYCKLQIKTSGAATQTQQQVTLQRTGLLADDEDFNMLLELADEADANGENAEVADPASCIPGSDGEDSHEEDPPQDPLAALAEEAEEPEPKCKKRRLSVPGKHISASEF